jgi:hypothetical protein
MWIKLSNEFERFINLSLSLTHPDLYEAGLAMLEQLRELETTKEVARDWQSVYNGIAIISNQKTLSHRDRRGRPQWFDTLMSYSEPNARPQLLINDLGLDLEYNSGTVVSFCGTVLEHEVKAWGAGERVCYAHFMREEIRDRLDVSPAGWVDRSRYLPLNLNIQEEENNDEAMELD